MPSEEGNRPTTASFAVERRSWHGDDTLVSPIGSKFQTEERVRITPATPTSNTSIAKHFSLPLLTANYPNSQTPNGLRHRSSPVPLNTNRVRRSTSFSSSQQGDSVYIHRSSLVRRHTRSITSEMAVEEIRPDDDATRWAETIRARRSAKRKAKAEEDDMVLVGTRVSEGHVNWVIAYNMLTGIRVAVCCCNFYRCAD